MQHDVYDAILPAPFGALGVRVAADRLAGLDFLPPGTPPRPSRNSMVTAVSAELDAYYRNPGHPFRLPLALAATAFRQRVWQALCAIPAGQTRTYGDIALDLNSSPRAVGQAVGDNPIPIVIPCHRVLARNGLGGFMHGRDGFPLDVKRWLLRHENALAG